MKNQDIDLATLKQAIRATVQWVSKGGQFARERSGVLEGLAAGVKKTGRPAKATLEKSEWGFSISEWVFPGSLAPRRDNPEIVVMVTTCEIAFKARYSLYVMPGSARDVMLRTRGVSDLDIRKWFPGTTDDATARVVWLPAAYSGTTPAENVKIEDVYAQAAWCIFNSGRSEVDVEKFLWKYAYTRLMSNTRDLRYSETALGEIFIGNYRGHLSSLSLKSYLKKLSYRRVDSLDIPPIGDLLENTGGGISTGPPTSHAPEPIRSNWNIDPNIDRIPAPSLFVDTPKDRLPKTRFPEDVLLTVQEVAKIIGVGKRTLYLALERGDIDCVPYLGKAHKRSITRPTPWGDIESDTGVRYLFESEQIFAAKEFFDSKARRQLVIAVYAERRGISKDSARKWVERKEEENPGISIEELAELVKAAKKKATAQKPTTKKGG